MRRIWIAAAAALVVVLVAGGLAVAGVFRDDQEFVEVGRGDPIPAASSLNTADDAGADVVRAYLAAAVACSAQGRAAMDRLSTADGRTDGAEVFGAACRGDDGWRDDLQARMRPTELDGQGRARWVVDAEGLPSDVVLRVPMVDGAWRIGAVCSGRCA